MRGLSACTDEDIILISDADEIVHHDTIAKIAQALKEYQIIGCEQKMFRFFLNVEDSTNWTGTFACYFNYLKNANIDFLRKTYCHNQPPPLSNTYTTIKNAGWHFTWMGGDSRVLTKIDSFAHTPLNTPEFRDIRYLKSPQYIIDIIQKQCHIVDIDSSYPEFIVNNVDAFHEKGFIFNGKIEFRNQENDRERIAESRSRVLRLL